MRKLIQISALSAGALSAAPVMALDCARARAPVEKAICGDPDAEAADEDMAKAYNALAATLSPQHMAALVTSQRRWLKRRADICLAREGEGVASCLVDETKRRRAFLAGEPLSGPGAAQKFRPVLIQHVGKPYQYDLDVNAQEFADPALPGEKLFNAKVDKLLEGVPGIEQSGFRQKMVYSYMLDVSATFASPQFVSAHVELDDFSGGAHGNSSTSNFAIDLETGKELSFADLFEPAAKQQLVDQCLAQIRQQKREKMPDDPFGVVSEKEQKAEVKKSVGDLSRWTFTANKAEVTFDPYALGAYVEGPYFCDFPAALLRPLLKVDYFAPAPKASPAAE
jgi:uncharacterized protein YecT (DUF1311 family)